MSDIAIKVENLSKRYRIGLEEELPDTFVGAAKNFLLSPIRNFRQLRALSRFEDGSPESEDGKEMGDGRRETGNAVLGPPSSVTPSDVIWALKDVSFEVKRGEVVGIIGRNGAGKSTLLKILSRITHPTSGRVKLNGRVSSLLEVGTGFHPELTGRENIYLNGTILGMTKAEVDRKFDEIVDFSGVEKFIDTPVKRYSSGMRVRLAFSVAAHLEPEILLVDEVLAVGDAEFQKKCLGKMDEVASQGRTVLFVSHNMKMIQKLCPETILLQGGHMIARGDSAQIVQLYLGNVTDREGEYCWNWDDEEINEVGPFIPIAYRILDSHGTVTERVSSDIQAYIEIEYEVAQRISNLRLGVTLSTGDGELFCVAWENVKGEKRKPGIYVSRCEIPKKLFRHGGFIAGIISGMPGQKLYRNFEVLRFFIDGGTQISHLGTSVLRPEFPWNTEQKSESI
jgi:lipopolysaccharide transport system ATP-binding protein